MKKESNEKKAWISMFNRTKLWTKTWNRCEWHDVMKPELLEIYDEFLCGFDAIPQFFPVLRKSSAITIFLVIEYAIPSLCYALMNMLLSLYLKLVSQTSTWMRNCVIFINSIKLLAILCTHSENPVEKKIFTHI